MVRLAIAVMLMAACGPSQPPQHFRGKIVAATPFRNPDPFGYDSGGPWFRATIQTGPTDYVTVTFDVPVSEGMDVCFSRGSGLSHLEECR